MYVSANLLELVLVLPGRTRLLVPTAGGTVVAGRAYVGCGALLGLACWAVEPSAT